MGKSKADYMRNYRRKKREEKLKTEKVEPKKIALSSTQRSRNFRARAANSILSQRSMADPNTALPNLTVSHTTLRLPFPPIPSTSSAAVCNTGPEIHKCPPDVIVASYQDKSLINMQAEASVDGRVRVKHESEEDMKSVAADIEGWIKREHNVYETKNLRVEEHLQIEPTVLQSQPCPVAMPKSVAADIEGWIKREHNVYETENLRVEEHLQIEPTMLQSQPCPVAMPKCPEVKLEPQSEEELSSGCPSPATAVPPAGSKQTKGLTIRKPHICNMCQREYTCLVALIAHLRIHTGETPYKCTTL